MDIIAQDQKNAIILFDGVCNLCNASVRFVIARDRSDRFRFATLQSEAGRSLAAHYTLPTDLRTFFLIDDGQAYEKSAAWLRIIRLLGMPWLTLYYLVIVPRPVRDWVYDFVGRIRYQWFGKLDQCPLPAPDWQKKFLS